MKKKQVYSCPDIKSVADIKCDERLVNAPVRFHFTRPGFIDRSPGWLYRKFPIPIR